MLPIELNPNHEIIKPIRRSVAILIIKIFFLLFLVDTVYAFLLIANVSGYIPVDLLSSYAVFIWVIYTAKFIFLAYLVLKLIIDWTNTLYYVANDHLIRQRGVLNTTETIFQLSDIEAVVMSRSWLGRTLNYGDVTITFDVARQKEFVYLYAVNDPERYESFFSTFV
jgi:uncharacterized membrane protein YdbT with pleckstrin-like domain